MAANARNPLWPRKRLNVEIYSNENFNHRQMSEIRKGLESNINVSIYSNPEFTWEEMRRIRFDLGSSK